MTDFSRHLILFGTYSIPCSIFYAKSLICLKTWSNLKKIQEKSRKLMFSSWVSAVSFGHVFSPWKGKEIEKWLRQLLKMYPKPFLHKIISHRSYCFHVVVRFKSTWGLYILYYIILVLLFVLLSKEKSWKACTSYDTLWQWNKQSGFVTYCCWFADNFFLECVLEI